MKCKLYLINSNIVFWIQLNISFWLESADCLSYILLPAANWTDFFTNSYDWHDYLYWISAFWSRSFITVCLTCYHLNESSLFFQPEITWKWIICQTVCLTWYHLNEPSLFFNLGSHEDKLLFLKHRAKVVLFERYWWKKVWL